MHFKARHVTRYRYSQPVWCGPLTVRLRPRTDFRQRLLSFASDMRPAPNDLCDGLDLEGNGVATTWFKEELDLLSVTTSFEAQTDDVNPFQFVLRPDATRLPLVPAREEEPHFTLYAQQREHSSQIDELAQDLAQQSGFDTVEFLCSLNEWIHARHEKILRPEGAAWDPQRTLQE